MRYLGNKTKLLNFIENVMENIILKVKHLLIYLPEQVL